MILVLVCSISYLIVRRNPHCLHFRSGGTSWYFPVKFYFFNYSCTENVYRPEQFYTACSSAVRSGGKYYEPCKDQ